MLTQRNKRYDSVRCKKASARETDKGKYLCLSTSLREVHEQAVPTDRVCRLNSLGCQQKLKGQQLCRHGLWIIIVGMKHYPTAPEGWPPSLIAHQRNVIDATNRLLMPHLSMNTSESGVIWRLGKRESSLNQQQAPAKRPSMTTVGFPPLTSLNQHISKFLAQSHTQGPPSTFH
jgi:hypothetical protein